MYTYGMIDMAIRSLDTRYKYLNMAIQGANDEIDEDTIRYARKELEMMELTKEALEYYKANGIGNNIDERR